MRVLLLCTILFAAGATAEPGVYQSRADFLRETLGSENPMSDVVWFDETLRAAATNILGHPPGMLRVRYWYDGSNTAWVLNEIGKEKPITMGIVVKGGKITSFRVLEFRETRGWEIRYPFFAEQFSGVALNNSARLDQRIDSVSGATLSVRAATRTANLALLLDQHARTTNRQLAQAR